jgi:hypothetical protein
MAAPFFQRQARRSHKSKSSPWVLSAPSAPALASIIALLFFFLFFYASIMVRIASVK